MQVLAGGGGGGELSYSADSSVDMHDTFSKPNIQFQHTAGMHMHLVEHTISHH